MTDAVGRQLIGIAIPTLKQLRASTLACMSASPAGEADAVDALREAGFAGGPAVYEAFEQWLAEADPSESARAASELTIDEFGDRAARYFRDAGWGAVEFETIEDEGIASLTMDNCWEADQSADCAEPSCHITTGMLAAFFGKLAGYPVAVMEIECRSAHAGHCRFLLGNSEMMTFKWESLR
jgi:predicted hydrocarbon binding protein